MMIEEDLLVTLRLIHNADRRPLGRFVSVTTRDAHGRSRSGQPFFAWTALQGTDPRQYEVQFADGEWMLCDAVEMQAGYFDLEKVRPRSWPAVEFGPARSGWVTPVVARSVLESVLVEADEEHVWNGDEASVGQEHQLAPRRDGLYDLATLGWSFQLAGASKGHR